MDDNNQDVKINTARFKREGKIEVDGMLWTVKLPGARSELKLSRTDRRIKQLDKKMEEGLATDADYDLYDELEDYYYNFFRNLFIDGTKDNYQVNKWVDETPIYIIAAAFQDLMEQASNQND